ncbi:MULTISPECIES: glycosyltransferase family 4 protein [unclassified Methylobacterium]|uniref:glycosyltransferase family 4 protein n=1 Tax=unclassified Methylobacterium TaxID=2615210 RepID=UPI00226AB916|nr:MULTISPECIES: glycosyltransferase family 4 protein [unclassified Methylobacterium]
MSDTNCASPNSDDRKINVFVHLAENKDAGKWRADYDTGRLPGRNDRSPYGYDRATGMGCHIVFSKSHRENVLQKFIRLALRVILGFDIVHAYRQRKTMLAADIVWTHTESQFLAVAAMLNFFERKPLLIGQAIWFFDHWKKLSRPKKYLYSRLVRNVDILTTHSPLNAAEARKIFENQRVEIVLFGIPAENPTPPKDEKSETFSLISLGNDVHRDWRTLVDAIADRPEIPLDILSATAPKRLANNRKNVTIFKAETHEDVANAYRRADVVVVPLRENTHASGITVIFEAILSGLPVIATRTGGLDAYFSEDEIKFVPPGDVDALKRAIDELRANQQMRIDLATRAQRRIADHHIDANGYIKRHVDLSRDLLMLRAER